MDKRNGAAICFAGMLCLCLGGSAGGQEESSFLDEKLREMLKRGDVVTVEEPDEEQRRFVTVVSEINAPPGEVWELITNFGRYPDLFHEVEKTKVVRREGNTCDVRHFMRMDMAVPTYRYGFTLRFLIDEAHHRLDWHLIDGDLKFFNGSWRLFAGPDGKTIMVYRITFDVIPRGYLAKKVVQYISEKNPVYAILTITSTGLVVTKSVKEEFLNKRE